MSALRLLVGGDRYVPSELAIGHLDIGTTGASQGDSKLQAAKAGPAAAHGVKKLTARELQALQAAAAGKQNKIIADELQVSQHTVKLHMHHVIVKLGLKNRTEAAVWYLNNRSDAP